MPSQFAARSIRLGQLFAGPILMQAAPYQRSYAWEAEEAGRLLEDVMSALDGEDESADTADYFLGTLLFIDPDRAALTRQDWPLAGLPRAFEIVDGLQRLTTLTILFCALRDLDADEGARPHAALLAAVQSGAKPRLMLRGKDEHFLERHVRVPGATQVMPEGEQISPAEERILDVREHLLGALLDLDAVQRRRLADFLLERCSVVLAATIGIDRAHRMFTVLNDTGKPLARNDILKAELLGSVAEHAVSSACAAWDDIEARLGHDFESLFSHIRAMHGRPGGHIIAGIRSIADSCGGAEAFIAKVLTPAAAALDELRHALDASSPPSDGVARTLRYLHWLPPGDWMPSAMLWRLGKGKDAAEFAWFLRALERLAYGLRILGLGTTRRTQRFGAVISAIRNGSDLKAAGSPLNLSREELRVIDYNLRDLHARSAPLCKLVLLRLSDEIAGSPQNLAAADFTVEHVLPRKLGSGSPWRKAFPDPQEREQCTEALGNLVLVTKAQNDKASNLDFARKHAIYFPQPRAPVPAINEDIHRQQVWTPKQVRERDADLLRRLQALWGFGSGDSRRVPDSVGTRAGRRRRSKPAQSDART